ncbi:MAG: aspartate aminotransferase family protein [Candidatus Omnitrophica bacterium]|nr:aspartate aminotransferase family protein [Candidatus Omnitrophota bacterium]
MSIKSLYKKYLLNTYTRTGPVFVKGKGSFLWDERGRKFIDFFPGWGVNILGHCHPRIVKVLSSQAKRLIHIPNNLYHKQQAELAAEIVKNSFKKGRVFFANSGAEAVEAGLKLAKAYGRRCQKLEIICMENSFHGRTLGALSCTAQEKYQAPFRPLLPHIKVARFGDFEDFKRKVSQKTCAVILEPIQGEGGVNFASKEYFLKLRRFSTENKILLIFDEIQTGLGRTGKLFCYQNYGIEPDLFTLSKGLGAGFPISALVVKEKYSDILKPGMHASTFGGNPLACRVGLEVFRIIKKEKVLENVQEKEVFLRKKLNAFSKKFGIIKEIRGLGFIWAIELKIEAKAVFEEAFKNRLIINSTHNTILRIMPALNIETSVLNKGLDILEKVLKKFS